MDIRSLIVVPLLFAAGSLGADICHYTAQRRVAAPTGGVSRIVVIGRAGTLHVTGHPGSGDVVATGTACSSDKDYPDEIQLTANRSGSVLRIEAVIPGQTFSFNFGESRLDFNVSVPDSLPVEVEDGSGSLLIENVGPLKVNDGSGELTVRGVRGDLAIEDGSGSIEVDRVSGTVRVTDGSGGMTIRHVDQSVIVESDGSGSIDVSDVRGDFIVEHDGSGGVHYERVAGKVRVPRD